jgi:hypothetical protein
LAGEEVDDAVGAFEDRFIVGDDEEGSAFGGLA